MPKQRRSIPSLYDLSKKSVKTWITRSIQSQPSIHFVSKARKLLRKSTFPLIRQQLLQELLPFENVWQFGCLQSKKRSRCKLHSECILMYSHTSKVLKFLFGADIQSFKMDLKKIGAQNREESMSTLIKAIKMSTYTRLRELLLPGGCSAVMDEYLNLIEDLAYFLKKRAPFLTKLQIPVGSNAICTHVAMLPELQYLVIDRTKHFNFKGLIALSHPTAFTMFNLRVLHLGIFKHHHFNKTEVAFFLSKMVNLTAFSTMDEDRGLVDTDKNCPVGAKIMTYSALKLAMTNHTFRAGEKEPFVCNLQDVKVVDRCLNPDYLLQTCPNLTKLHLDWQHELTQPPFNNLPSHWFSQLVLQPGWRQLVGTLTELSITFPATYSPLEGYSCPATDFLPFIAATENLKSLRLKGMINTGHVSILDFLYHCTSLEELVLEKCSVFLPDPSDYPQFPPHLLLKKLHVCDKTSAFLASRHNITHCIIEFMPKLQELVLRPEEGHAGPGLSLDDLRQLAALRDLQRLEVPVSMEDSVSNMPEFIFALREFASLRFLTVSWVQPPPEMSQNMPRKFRLLEWLDNALLADNANIHLQISHSLHSSLYTNPPANVIG